MLIGGYLIIHDVLNSFFAQVQNKYKNFNRRPSTPHFLFLFLQISTSLYWWCKSLIPFEISSPIITESASKLPLCQTVYFTF